MKKKLLYDDEFYIKLQTVSFNNIAYEPNRKSDERYYLEIKASNKQPRKTQAETYDNFLKTIIDERINLGDLVNIN